MKNGVRILAIMPNVETIYKQTILPLPPSDRIRLAQMILENANDKRFSLKGRRSVIEILENSPVNRVFKNSDEVDGHVRSERESWDN